MKRSLTILLVFCAGLSLKAQNTDLPSPDANLKTLPSGSYVIPMDNTLQLNSSGDFNLKAYGLIVYLLNNDVHVQWSIKAGKAKDGIDFTATAEQIKPTLITGGVSRNFKAGPFVIFAADTSGVAALIDGFNTANSLTGANRPQVYRLTADALNVDIRYNLSGFRPKAAVLTDGGNQNIHLAYMTAAAIPASSYATSAGTDLLTNCFTFASEPHNTNSGTAVNNAISAIRDFVTKGGNFLAQCEAVNNYENNSLGRFQSTGGLTISNTNVGTTLTYANPDLSFSQYEGAYNASQGGSLKNWKFVGSTTNNEHEHATGTGANSTVMGASVSKHYYDKGGLVFYIGNHSFATTTTVGINGIRMFMNAFLTPSNTNCPEFLSTPLAVRLIYFGGNHKNNRTMISWTIADNEMANYFIVERSSDGSRFVPITTIRSSGHSGNESYQFSETQSISGSLYRLRLADRQGREQYSPVVSFTAIKNVQQPLRVLKNAGKDDLMVSYYSDKNTIVSIHAYNSLGSLIYSSTVKCIEGINIMTVPGSLVNQKGIYYLETVDGYQRFTTKTWRL